jgi:uncharacterized protein
LLKLEIREAPNLVAGSAQNYDFELEKFADYYMIWLGRHSENNIVIAEPSVSKNHAMLMLHNNVFLVCDLGSLNGTWLNSKRLEADQWHKIKLGDYLKIGEVILEIMPVLAAVAEVPTLASLPPSDLRQPTKAMPVVQEVISLPPGVLSLLTPSNPVLSQLDASLSDVSVRASGSTQAETSKTNLISKAKEKIAVLPRLIVKSFSTGGGVLFWTYLGIITLAEYLTAAIRVELGLLLHALLLVGLIVHGTLSRNLDWQKLILALTVAPLIRLLSMSLPLSNFPQIMWYGMVSIPLLLATWLIARQLGVKREALGLTATLPQNWWVYLMLTSGGIFLGVIEYLILKPKPLIDTLSWATLLPAALSLMIFTGFSEEIIFRGLLQTLALPVLKKWALVYVSLVFAVLHIGYLSFFDVVFVFLVGLLFAYIVYWSGSILGVCLAHGLTNITLFLIMPYLAQNPSTLSTDFINLITTVSLALFFTAIVITARKNRKLITRDPVCNIG